MKELRKLAEAANTTREQRADMTADDFKIAYMAKVAFQEVVFSPTVILQLLDKLEAAGKLVKAIKTDRHDWEDWPRGSREAFEALKDALEAK